jgi:hypothetical protein
MITILTSELNRINQGCGRGLCIGTKSDVYEGIISLCDNCQKEKETLKKVSLMWADEELEFMREMNLCEVVSRNFMVLGDVEEKIRELKQIKSLIENQEDFQKLGSHEPSQMEKA